MRYLARIALLGVALSLGCGSLFGDSDPSSPGQPVALHVSFDDLSASPKPVVPIRLTASDGSGLALVGLEARAVVDDPLAFTELHLTFENTENRVREGTFSIVLPQGASISRFAMKTPGGLQEGEVVERKQAREAYEDFLHRKQDPALLEQNAGNEFSARVFPIPARGKKELIVSYSQELTSVTPYVLPLKGLPEIGSLDIEMFVAGHAAPAQKLSRQRIVPDGDFRLDAKLFTVRGGLRSGNLVAARVKPVVASRPEPLDGALILIDTSASRALGMAEEGRIAARLCAAIAKASGDKGQVVVAAYDQSIEPIYEGAAARFGDTAIARMRQRLALGASNLEAALGWAGERARAKGLSRVIVITDGIPTAGATGGDRLRARALSLKDSGVERLDAIGVGGIRDDDLLRSIATAGLAKGGVVIDSVAGEEEMVRRLSEATVSGVEIKVENATFVFPGKLDGVQAGDEALVYANVPDNKSVRISVGGGAWEAPDLARVERPLLERAWVGAKIKSLLEAERTSGPSAALSREIVGLSTQFRVLSPKSALLVLETDHDYQRFGIDRRALVDVLVADGGKVSLLRRSTPLPAKAPPATPQVAANKKADEKPRGPVAKSKPAAGAAPGDISDELRNAVGGEAAKPAWGNDSSLGNDPMSARGNMWGESTGDAVGAGGLGLSGIGEGGGGRAEGIGLGRVGTVGHGAGTSSGQGNTSSAGAAAPPSQSRRGPAAKAVELDDNDGPVTAGQMREEGNQGERLFEASEEAFQRNQGRRSNRDPEVTAEHNQMDVGEHNQVSAAPEESPDFREEADPYEGPFKVVMSLIAQRRLNEAVEAAFDWRKRDPGDILALVALGEGFEAAGDLSQAARCYGSLIDLFPSRADMRRFAGERLERLSLAAALELAADSYEKAVEQRPDHPSSHRLHAYSLLRRGRPEKAFEALQQGLQRSYPEGRFAGVQRILAEDLGLIGAAWAKAEPKREAEILRRVRAAGGLIEDTPSLRFVLNWETDANDVDFHIFDANGGHAYYKQPTLTSGGLLYADVTTGYGPECFTIRNAPGQRSGPYMLQAHYYSRGPMGYGMGKLEIIEHDGHGKLTFVERPFVVMKDRAFFDLGKVAR